MSETTGKEPINYLSRTILQAERVEKLAKEQKDSPATAAMIQLEIEAEKLAFYENAAKGDPKSRAAATVESIRKTMLARAITPTRS